ncbi:CubicO group peptidase, beta-lactamase class C family [Cyclobacterium xiamenense]|uniref:CubicO group peptidase, beta-lactamase class C family n=1 Tax=Cyclobacterium xiamenense TaxID=1297121 RepID=A0A1H7A5L2_9BACT|nr:serine hydrolase [Cyclobacterium xiamenense]SEJ60963.1 CubicO group peptidase, beta-lactamase class C family [Cyclobacterium xiamenense]
MISATYYLILCHFLMISTQALSQKSGNGTDRFPEVNDLVQGEAGQRTTTVFPGEHWALASPESQGLHSGRLTEAIRYLEENSGSDGVKELLIVRNGYLVWEGEAVDKVHGVWSVTKSFTSTALGLLIADGKASLATLAHEIAPDMGEHYPQVTLAHFATMTSGYRAEGDEPRGLYTHGPSTTPFIPGPPLFTPPGSKYAYWDSAMNQFAYILTQMAAEPLDALLKRRLLDPIGMNPDQWHWGDFGETGGYRINGGAGNGGKHVFISAREIARFGLLFLNHGAWEGKQLLPREWVRQACSVQVPSTLPLGHTGSVLTGSGAYGLNWWVNGIRPTGERKWPDAPTGTFAAWGHNNNYVFVIPEWNMVVVRLGLDQSDRVITDAISNQFIAKIGEALSDVRKNKTELQQ